MLKAKGFDKAIIGVAERCGSENVIAYDANECILIIMCSVLMWERIHQCLFGTILLRK